MNNVKAKPGPNKYLKENDKGVKLYGHTLVKPLGNYTQKEEYPKTHFTDCAKVNHKQNSVAVGKYDAVWIPHKPKYRTSFMGKKPESVEPWRIKKDSEPGPGSYPIEDVIRKTQWHLKNPFNMKMT